MGILPLSLDSGGTVVRQADEGAVVLDPDPLDAGEGLGHEGVHIQGALGGDDILEAGAGVGMPGGEDGAAVLIGQDGGLVGADAAGGG